MVRSQSRTTTMKGVYYYCECIVVAIYTTHNALHSTYAEYIVYAAVCAVLFFAQLAIDH